MLIEYKGKTLETKNYVEVSDEERQLLRAEYYKKPDKNEVIVQLRKLASNGVMMDKINRYYFRELMAQTQIYSAKWTVDDVFNSNELLGVFKAKTLTNKKVFPDDMPLSKKIEAAIRLSGKGYAKIPTNYPMKSVREILNKYNINNNFYDFSCGWGVRLIGAMSRNINYFGTDPNPLLMIKLYELINDYKSNIMTTSQIELREQGSEIDILEWHNKMGLAFSSPPYYNLEDYKFGNQSYKDGVTYEDWIDNYLCPTLQNIYKYLITGGILALNIKDFNGYELVKKSKEICNNIGFHFQTIETLNNIQRTKSTTGKTDNSEGIYIFKKY